MSKKIYLIAGEASGDFLGAQLMQALKEKEPDVEFHGIGGPLMQAQGLRSLFAMQELSLMGIMEIFPKIIHLLKRIRQTIQHIDEIKPDMVVTIDAPDFSFRVMKGVRKRMTQPPILVHYVAPTVWAWRENRAAKIARFLDAIICLFDFEPPYFEKEGLKAIAVGHPMMESGLLEAEAFSLGAAKTQKLGVFFGSRQGEIKRISPVILEALEKIIKDQPAIELVVPTLPHLKAQIGDLLKNIEVPIHIETSREQKWQVFKSCDAAIAVSGTVGLELAAADVPHIIAYKMNPLTFQILRGVIKVKYAHLANIMEHREIVPEFIQDDCTSGNIANATLGLLSDRHKRSVQIKQFEAIRLRIGGEKSPSLSAAEFLLSL
jgi:lipid-A-disaccharide synthase